MKISNYNQLLAVSTLVSGMIIFATLWSQNQKVESISREHFESRLLAQTVNHISTMSQAWLTTQDLLFSGKQTYLVNGINIQSKQLTQTLIAIKTTDKSNNKLIQQLLAIIKSNKTIIDSFAQLTRIDDKVWQSTITKSDSLTAKYVMTLETLLQQVSVDNSALENKLIDANSFLAILTWVIISLYLIFISFIVTWFSKYIVKPIENITEAAQQSSDLEQNVEFMQEDAPAEVIALSSAIESFTQRITVEKHKADQERRNVITKNKQIKAIMNTIPCSLLLLNDHGVIQECNPEACRLFSKTKEEIVSQNIAIFLPVLSMLDGQFDTKMLLRNMEESLLAPSFENPYIEFSGREIAINGSINYLLTITDINERKHSQKALSSLNQQLVNAEKLASIGQLSAGIAHEINNPVGFIHSNLDVLADYITPLTDYIKLVKIADQQEQAKAFYQKNDLDYIIDDINPLIESSLEGTIRISKIIKDLGNYAHVDSKTPELISIDSLIEQSLTLVANELKYKVKIVKSLNANVSVMAFPQKLLQVFINMLVNASHAIENTGRISIYSGIVKDEINIRFEDDGSGISQEHLKNIFDPFFTTKPVGKGTGLGLHIVRSIIDEHDGHIEASSIVGQGSKFEIFLPIHSAADLTKSEEITIADDNLISK